EGGPAEGRGAVGVGGGAGGNWGARPGLWRGGVVEAPLYNGGGGGDLGKLASPPPLQRDHRSERAQRYLVVRGSLATDPWQLRAPFRNDDEPPGQRWQPANPARDLRAALAGELKRRSEGRQGRDLVRARVGEMKREQRAHPQPGDDASHRLRAELLPARERGRVPILPGRRSEILDACAVARQEWRAHGVAALGQALAERAHLARRAGKAVKEEATDGA